MQTRLNEHRHIHDKYQSNLIMTFHKFFVFLKLLNLLLYSQDYQFVLGAFVSFPYDFKIQRLSLIMSQSFNCESEF